MIKLLGACIDKAGPILLIMEFAEHGSLRSFLHLCRGGAGVALSGATRGHYQHRVIEQTRPHQLTTKDLLCFSWQVGRGMEYLSKKKVKQLSLLPPPAMLRATARLCVALRGANYVENHHNFSLGSDKVVGKTY